MKTTPLPAQGEADETETVVDEVKRPAPAEEVAGNIHA
jgi:hypothetical protein